MKIAFGKSWYRWVILAICIMVYFSGNLVRWNYTGISSYLTKEWAIGKPELGILGAVFFYSYAIGQSPWGSLTDIFGGRKVISFGIFLTAAVFAVFAMVTGYQQALVVRAMMGLVAGAGFVTCLSVLSRWFGKKERGLAFSIFSGAGGGLGEVSSFLFMPLISLFMVGGASIFGLTSWRASTMVMAIIILGISIATYLFLRSSPTELGLPSVQKEEDVKVESISYKETLILGIRDPWFWIISMVWVGFVVCLRLVPGWLPIYAAAYYKQVSGMSTEAAMVAGGGIGSIYVAARIFGTPIAGKFSDYLLTRYKVPRSVMILGIHSMLFVSLYVLSLELPSTFFFAILAFVLGMLINMFSLVNAAVTEIWSIKTCGALMGLVNTVGQLAGGTALAYSGYMANRFSVKGGGYFLEYRGIWYLAMIAVFVGISAALLTIYRERRSIREVDALKGETGKA